MKIIFLDIDGVLVTTKTARTNTAAPACIEVLNKIIADTGASIVISSSWKHYGLPWLRDKLNEWGVVGSVIDLTPTARITTTQRELLPRSYDVVLWLYNYRDVESFLILDDEDEFLDLREFHVRTYWETGLNWDDFPRAIRILNG